MRRGVTQLRYRVCGFAMVDADPRCATIDGAIQVCRTESVKNTSTRFLIDYEYEDSKTAVTRGRAIKGVFHWTGKCNSCSGDGRTRDMWQDTWRPCGDCNATGLVDLD